MSKFIRQDHIKFRIGHQNPDGRFMKDRFEVLGIRKNGV
jgi:hypothetical protein